MKKQFLFSKKKKKHKATLFLFLGDQALFFQKQKKSMLNQKVFFRKKVKGEHDCLLYFLFQCLLRRIMKLFFRKQNRFFFALSTISTVYRPNVQLLSLNTLANKLKKATEGALQN